jgi:hypothetical protein
MNLAVVWSQNAQCYWEFNKDRYSGEVITMKCEVLIIA